MFPTYRRSVLLTAATLTASTLMAATAIASPGSATKPTRDDSAPPAQAVARGTGGAVSSVDASASKVGLEVLRKGGNATDAAVAMASTLGVTEPYSAGIGGGGYFVHYDAKTGRVQTIDGRETAPAAMPNDAFIDPKTQKPYRFTPELVTSGVSVGVPGTLATWQHALSRWGTTSLDKALKPSSEIARKGFVVDRTFSGQTEDNAKRFAAFPSTAKLYLPNGAAPEVGTIQRNPDLADTLDLIRKHGTKAFYRGAIANDIATAVKAPPKDPNTALPVPEGFMTTQDLARYKVLDQPATKVDYRGLDVYGMAPSSSGGTTVGEALNILETYKLGDDIARTLHLFLEASAHAFADRGAYVGDPAYVDVPTKTLLSQNFADSRACRIDPAKASTKPVPAGALSGGGCTTAAHDEKSDTENVSTTHLSVVDRWGNAVAYTLTIEQTGGSGIVVPGRGFLLNNELTDFTTVYDDKDPNRIQPGKRPRSSMSPTIVAEDGQVKLVVGSPGGSTIITTVLQILVNRLDIGLSLPEAIAAPRASQRNTASVSAEPSFIKLYEGLLTPYGHTLTKSGDEFTSAAEIGAAAGIEVDKRGGMTAAAEPVRRGGGAANVVCPSDHKRGCR
ncbi:MAG: gamma-glutamyltransferase [Actinomycetota bacterium]|nr:gamma-glutamyltransferase [Actinomycetota bacterium]